jgi:hypothetical protein
MGPSVKRRLPLAIGLLVIAGIAVVWSISSSRGQRLPTEPAMAGSDPVSRAADDPQPDGTTNRVLTGAH